MKKVSRRSFAKKVGLGIGSASILPTLVSFENCLPKMNAPYAGKKLNVALCGLGRYANILANGLAASEFCTLTGIITGTPAKATSWQRKYRIPAKNIYDYGNFDNIATNEDIDLVYIVLPNGMHKEYAIRAAEAGKHVIVEKPMAINASEALEIITACRKANVQLAVGYRLHFEPYNMEMKRLGQEKVFGQVRHVQASLGYRVTPDVSDWHLKKSLSGGGALQNLGVYCIQAARYITGEEPISVTAQFGPTEHKAEYKEVEESIHWQMEFPSGAFATCSSSYNYGIDRLYAAADTGEFELSPAISYGPFVGKSSNGPMNFPQINQQQTQMDELAKFLLNNKSFPVHISGEEGYKDMKVIDAIYMAAETGNTIDLS